MPRPGRRRRRGATMLELLVALLLLDLALVSLAAMAAVSARRVGDAGRRTRAVVAAVNRMEGLAAQPCARMTAGERQIEQGVTERWSVRSMNGGVEISDSLELRGAIPEHIVLRTRVPC